MIGKACFMLFFVDLSKNKMNLSKAIWVEMTSFAPR